VDVGASGNWLFGVAAIGPDDVWAAGLASSNRRVVPLVEHWDGAEWTSIHAPAHSGYVRALAGTGANDVWAVGVQTGSGGADNTLIDHWDGSVWSAVPSPNEGGEGYLYGVTALSASDAWAVGFGASSNFQTMAAHWDGGHWVDVPTPDPVGVSTSVLHSVAAVGPDDVWAVGSGTIDASHKRTLIEHWNGSTWRIVPSPNRRGVTNDLNGVAALAPDDVWAVGYSAAYATTGRTLVEHWDGTSWSIVPSPTTTEDRLESVAAVSATNLWAVGMQGEVNVRHRTLIQHWDGAQWSTVTSPNPSPKSDQLVSVTALPTGELWAVGNDIGDGGHYRSLIESACMP
jgi:hypothetical protein